MLYPAELWPHFHCWRRGRDSNPRYSFPYAALARRCLRPLGHLSGSMLAHVTIRLSPAEGEGFEPPGLSSSGFQDRRLKPLGHPSKTKTDGLFSKSSTGCKVNLGVLPGCLYHGMISAADLP